MTAQATATLKPAKRQPGVVYRGKWACGRCAASQHPACVVATENGDRSLTRCGCGCEPSQGVRCRDCGERDPHEVGPDMLCADRIACRASVTARQLANPIWRALQEVKTDVARRRAEFEQAHPEAVERKRERLAELRRERVTAGSCLCCGEPTKGGLFLPGHDARLVAALAITVPRDPKHPRREATLAEARRKLEPCSSALKAKFERKVERGR